MKTTNRQARLNVRQYILDHFDPCGYDFTGPCTFQNVSRFILEVHASEKQYSPEYQAAKGFTNEMVFADWCQGLPSVLDTCYYYNRSAVADLGDILEQSERERAQYTEADPKSIKEPVEKIGYSSGVYGLNGGLLQGRESGNYYAITARSSNLFYFF